MNILKIQGELKGLIGGKARFTSYTSSHDRLTVEIVSTATLKRLQCIFCQKISAPTFWTLTVPEVTEGGNGFVNFRDQGVEIVCQEVVLEDQN
jgi:hypothetical protein